MKKNFLVSLFVGLLLVGCVEVSNVNSISSISDPSSGFTDYHTYANDLDVENEGGLVWYTIGSGENNQEHSVISKGKDHNIVPFDNVITLRAESTEQYVFKGWNINEVIDTNLTKTFTMTKELGDVYVVAMFEKVFSNYYSATFGHYFKQADFVQAGGTTFINGITWNYSPFSFLGGYTTGIQIGSKNSPQTSKWTLETTFPTPLIITSIYFELSNAAGGSGTYEVELDDYQQSEEFASTTLKEFSFENLETTTENFAFSLTANARAMYFCVLEISFLIPEEFNLDIYQDTLEADPVVPGENGIPSINYDAITPSAYYDSIDFSKPKELLLADLRNLLTNMTKTSYGQAKTMLQYTDESTTNPGFLYGLYDGDLIKATWDNGASWNREHVWACSQMQITSQARPDEDTRNHSTDLHVLRVACGPSNGEHGNKFYDNENTSITLFPNITSNLVGHHAYNGDFRGDVARILFYQYTRYAGLKLNDSLDVNDNVSMGKLSSLLSWHLLDPVDDFEMQRNVRIYGYQGNRNPFVDHPEIASIIFA
jgi:endonuclease I